ncbi:phage antirepressor KilAC domain-containing protein [Fusobacterium sp.]|uniref:phage antirepressor n=1 Tax=Fusobacterium sp. TaxID=68766 RepID=UPI002607E749|nr:phage antirepressor KilAC domain-containing protein [Fusobacterium sp.]
MGKLQILTEREVLGKRFKIYGDIDRPLFLAKDVATWIDYSFKDRRKINRDITKMVSLVDEDEKEKFSIKNSGEDFSPEGVRKNLEMWFLTEDGVYEILMQSRKPVAKIFKKNVKEILKSIRKTGGYIEIDEGEGEEEILKKAYVIAMKNLERKEKTIKDLKEKENLNRPKINFAEAVETSKHSILIGELAKIIKQKGYDIGQQRLFAWLRENDYLVKRGESYNMPTQKSMELKLFEIKESLITHSDGHQSIKKTTKVTGKGQVYFINLFTRKYYEDIYEGDIY